VAYRFFLYCREFPKAFFFVEKKVFFMAGELSKKLLDVLACPKCKGSLKYEKAKSRLVCKKCRLAYRVEDGIPIMLVEEAERI